MYLYLLKARNRLSYKIGITNNLKRRISEVNRGVKCKLVFAVPLLYAAKFERYLHKKYKHLRHDLKGTGKTEWFYFWLPVRPAFYMMLFFSSQVAMMGIIVAFFIMLGVML